MTFVSVMMFAATETTVYYTAPEATIGTYSVKLNVNFKGDGDDWHQFDMTKTALTYNGDPVYSYTYTDAYDGVGVMQFQLFDGETWKSQKNAINSWTGVATYNGKMYVHATEEWVAAPAEGGSEAQVETIYTWYGKRGETSATEAVETGGTAAAYGGNSNIVVGASQKTNWTMKFNKGFSNANYIGITLNEALVAGDKLQVAAFRTSGSDAVLGMDFSVDAENAATTCQILFPNNLQQITTNVAPEDTTFTIPECAAGAKFIRLYRNSGSTGVYVANFTVLREKGGETPDPIEPTPAEKDSIYFVNVAGWTAPRVHLWGGTAAGTEWPGVEMTKLEDQINNYDVYKYVADKGAYANCLFSDNGAEDKKTADLTWTSGKYFYNDAWYALNEIPVPLPDAVPLEGNIWKVTAETPLVAGSHYINEALLTMDGVYATNLKTNTRTIAGEEFTHAIQVRTDGYPTADKKAGKEKSGSTSLIITAKEDADVTFYYNRQVVGEGGTDNDNKDLVVFDQADITTKVAGVLTIDQILEGNNYLNATKKVALKKDHTYTVTASGTTLQLHGIKLEAHFPVMQIAGAWNVQDEAWLLNDMSLAEDKLTATYEVELTPGDYEFKMIKDGAWLTKANEGQAYGLHREWPGVAGVIDNATENLKVTADVAGNYVFTWTFANDSIGIAFPDAPIEPDPAKFYITGDSALVVDAGLDVEMKWNPAAIKSQKDTFVLSNLKADQYYLLKVTLDGTWNEGMVKGFNDLTEEIAGLDDVGDDHNIGFKLAEAGDVQVVYFVKDEVLTFKLIGNFYVDQTPVDPQEEVTVYFVNTPRWDGVNIYLWNNETFENNAAWPGLAMTKEETKVQGFDVYSYTFVNSKNFDKCIFNHIDQTADLELHAGQYYCVDTWYESIEAIPELDIDEPAPIDPTTAHFYIKHAGNNWTWVEMTYDAVMDAFTYQSVWAGNGANINTVGEDNGNAWYPAAMINVAEDVELRDTVLFAYNYNTKALSVTLVGKYVQKLANGYYIIGLNGWNVDDLSESDDLFYSTGIETGEFSLETTLTEGAVFKVVRVEGDVIINWYGIQTSEQNPDGNYIVDAAHAGEKTIYFRPEWNEDWAGHIYVAPNETTAISNTAADAEAVKVLHNGMLLIRKGNKTYNIMGQAVK